MNGILFEIKGNYGHFRKPETNNNPLTHDFITKTALIGLIGSVLGIERREMSELFPQLSENLLYGVSVQNSVKKESWSFTLRNVVDFLQKAPKQMEFLKSPENKIALALKDEKSSAIFDDFLKAIQQDEAKFTPVLGLHNCPAELHFLKSGNFELKTGNFATKGFITDEQIDKERIVSSKFRLGVERIPTFQNDDFWNLPERYKRVFYPSENNEIFGKGEFYEFTDGSQWTLI